MSTSYSEELKFDAFNHFLLEREDEDMVRIDVESMDHTIYTSLKFTVDQVLDIIKEIDLRLSDSEDVGEYKHIDHVELQEEGKWILDIAIEPSWTSLHFNSKDDIRRLVAELRKASS
jgi:hypothetical protein